MIQIRNFNSINTKHHRIELRRTDIKASGVIEREAAVQKIGARQWTAFKRDNLSQHSAFFLVF